MVFYVSVGIYVISLTQKSYCTSGGTCEYFSGLLNLIFGWFGVLMLHTTAFPWLANLILFASWSYFKKKPKTSFILSSISFILMLSFLLVDKITDDGSTTTTVISYGLGYWLWVLSSIMMLIRNLYTNKEEVLIGKSNLRNT